MINVIMLNVTTLHILALITWSLFSNTNPFYFFNWKLCTDFRSPSLANAIKLFMAVSYDFSLEARAFVPSNPFHPSLMFSGEDGAYSSEAPFRCSTLGQALALPANIRLGWKGLPENKRSSLLWKVITYSCKKFYNIGPWCQSFEYIFVSGKEVK